MVPAGAAGARGVRVVRTSVRHWNRALCVGQQAARGAVGEAAGARGCPGPCRRVLRPERGPGCVRCRAGQAGAGGPTARPSLVRGSWFDRVPVPRGLSRSLHAPPAAHPVPGDSAEAGGAALCGGQGDGAGQSWRSGALSVLRAFATGLHLQATHKGDTCLQATRPLHPWAWAHFSHGGRVPGRTWPQNTRVPRLWTLLPPPTPTTPAQSLCPSVPAAPR